MLFDASSAVSGWLDSPRTPHLAGAPCTLQTGWKRKKKFSKDLELFRANWKNLMRRWTGRRSGLRWTPVDARDRVCYSLGH
jgi:hypothetical protein